MEDGPTLMKLLVLITVLTVIYFIFIAPLFASAYYAVTDGDMKSWTDTLSKKLSFDSIKKLF